MHNVNQSPLELSSCHFESAHLAEFGRQGHRRAGSIQLLGERAGIHVGPGSHATSPKVWATEIREHCTDNEPPGNGCGSRKPDACARWPGPRQHNLLYVTRVAFGPGTQQNQRGALECAYRTGWCQSTMHPNHRCLPHDEQGVGLDLLKRTIAHVPRRTR